MAQTLKLEEILGHMRRLHALIRDAVVVACERSDVSELATIDHDDEGDTIYAVDRVSEELIVDFIEEHIAAVQPVVLIAEGLEGGRIVLPPRNECR